MRDIEFRGKRTANGEWVYGYIAEATICGTNGSRIETMIYQKPERTYDEIRWIVDPKTVGQYTGLMDANGTKIFEGDIVLAPYIDPIFKSTWKDASPCEPATVKYDDGMFYVEYIESGDKFTLRTLDGYTEVTGNIYDNPELFRR